MSIPCNMTPAEREEAFDLFRDGASGAELERARRGFRRYLFYDTWGRRDFREYFCPYCGRFEIEKPFPTYYEDDPFLYHHNDEVNCPMCGEEATLICLGRMQNMHSLEQWGRLIFLRARGKTLTISAGTAVRRFDREDLDPWPEYFETRRYVLGPGKRQAWKKVDVWECAHRVGHWWEPMKTVGEPFAPNMNYTSDGSAYIVGAENIEKTDMRYCQLVEFCRRWWGADLLEEDGDPAGTLRGAVRYLGEYSRRPQIEMLVKLGFTDAVGRLLDRGSLPRQRVNWRAKDPAGFFRMNKADFKVFRARGLSFEIMDAYDNRGKTAADMDLAEYLEARTYLSREADGFFKLCARLGLPARKALGYIRAQSERRGHMSGGNTFTLWKDYLDMAGRLERDMRFRRDVFPEELQREHDAAAALVVRVQEQETAKKYGPRFRRLKKKYCWTDGEYRITVPVNGADIEMEGKALEHCVGGYAKRHVEGKTTILFMRRCVAPEERYVTIEINDETGLVRQVHGYRNEADGAQPPMERHKEFFDSWLAWVQAGSPRDRRSRPVRIKTKDEQEVRTA